MKYLLAIVLLFSFNQAMAGYLSGGMLLEDCEAFLNKTDVAEGNLCSGYVMGIFDTHESLVHREQLKPIWCAPDGVDSTQAIRVVTKHLQKRPEDLHASAPGQVWLALLMAFPCE